MCVCVCVCVCVRVCVCVCACVHAFVRDCVYACAHERMRVHVCLRERLRTTRVCGLLLKDKTSNSLKLIHRLLTQENHHISRRSPQNCLLVGCLTSQQHACVTQGRICTDNFTCCHTETEAADQTFHLTQSQYTDTGPTSPSADPVTPGAWQGSHWSANV